MEEPPVRRRPKNVSLHPIVQYAAIALGALLAGGACAGILYLLVRLVAAYWPWIVTAVAIAAFLVIAGVVVSAVERHKARIREGQLRAIANLSRVDAMTGAEFEDLVARLLDRDGYRSVQVVGRTGDRGVDVTAICPDGRRVAVQCKRQKKTVGSDRIRNLIGAVHGSYAGHVGVLVTSSTFTRPALAEADGKLVLVERDGLVRWMDGEGLVL
jgi:restriction system protein